MPKIINGAKNTSVRPKICPSCRKNLKVENSLILTIYNQFVEPSRFECIFIANLAEISLGLIPFLEPSEVEVEIAEDHALSDRFIFSLPENSILITPHPIDKYFWQDSLALLSRKNVLNFFPKTIEKSVCEAVINDKPLFATLVATIKNNPGLSLISYAGTKEFFALIDKLQSLNLQFFTPEVPESKNRWTASFFGSKSGFRQAASALDSPFPSLPPGIISTDQSEIIGAASHFLTTSDGCVLKNNRGLAGAGLHILRTEAITGDPGQEVAAVVAKHHYFQKTPVVVERFIPPDMSICGGAPNIELKIAGGEVTPLYVCSMRVTAEGVFQGVEFGKDAVSDNLTQVLISAGEKYGQALLDYGYNGFFEIDFVQGLDSKTYPIESNLRRTGGTHAFELAGKLIWPDFLKTQLSDLCYPLNGKKIGLILTIISPLSFGRLGYVVIGTDRKEALDIEKQFLSRLN